MAKIEEQRKTKDEMMTFLRQEIDRRGEQMTEDREMYDKSVTWLHRQIEDKDSIIKQLNTEVRGLLEAPKGVTPPPTPSMSMERVEQAGDSETRVREAEAYPTAEPDTDYGRQNPSY